MGVGPRERSSAAAVVGRVRREPMPMNSIRRGGTSSRQRRRRGRLGHRPARPARPGCRVWKPSTFTPRPPAASACRPSGRTSTPAGSAAYTDSYVSFSNSSARSSTASWSPYASRNAARARHPASMAARSPGPDVAVDCRGPGGRTSAASRRRRAAACPAAAARPQPPGRLALEVDHAQPAAGQDLADVVVPVHRRAAVSRPGARAASSPRTGGSAALPRQVALDQRQRAVELAVRVLRQPRSSSGPAGRVAHLAQRGVQRGRLRAERGERGAAGPARTRSPSPSRRARRARRPAPSPARGRPSARRRRRLARTRRAPCSVRNRPISISGCSPGSTRR